MKLLLTAATRNEIAPLMGDVHCIAGQIVEVKLESGGSISVLITGVGSAATLFHLTRLLAVNRFDLVIQAGIAGAFNRNLELGSVVQIISDRFAQTGAEDGADFMDIFEMGLTDANTYPFKNGQLQPIPLKNGNSFSIKQVNGISVETVHGHIPHIDRIFEKYHPDTESMEGAAFFYTCMQMHIDCLQIRSISNYVEKRNKANWNIPLAVEQLNIQLKHIINDLIK